MKMEECVKKIIIQGFLIEAYERGYHKFPLENGRENDLLLRLSKCERKDPLYAFPKEYIRDMFKYLHNIGKYRRRAMKDLISNFVDFGNDDEWNNHFDELEQTK